jgi:protein-tyrosine-phosphatase
MINKKLDDFINQIIVDFDSIPEERMVLLELVSSYISYELKEKGVARLTFICTHNSRRSHMAQIWAQVAASYFKLDGVETFSGGTAVTAFFPRAVEALEGGGLEISSENKEVNPVYRVKYSADTPVIKVFSKKIDNNFNPGDDFCAIMTCSDADKKCPFIPGASKRVSITYEDPKAFDRTEKEAQAYMERSHQIAKEMFYMISRVSPE